MLDLIWKNKFKKRRIKVVVIIVKLNLFEHNYVKARMKKICYDKTYLEKFTVNPRENLQLYVNQIDTKGYSNEIYYKSISGNFKILAIPIIIT